MELFIRNYFNKYFSNYKFKQASVEKPVEISLIKSDGVISKLESIENILYRAFKLVAVLGSTYLITLYARKVITQLFETANISSEISRKLKRPELAKLKLNEYEARIANDAIVAIDELSTTFDDIGGMKGELENVVDSIVLPIQISKSMKGQSNGILTCPTGVLLYGRPGTGKSLTARALAKECSATFLQIKSSSLLDKWLGESDKLVVALFTLARKLAPTIIFIDEIDALLRVRKNQELTPAMASIQSLLLSEWDGLSSSDAIISGPVVVVGATNRPSDIDPAFLRRLPVCIKTSTPTKEGRADILHKMLSKEILSPELSIDEISEFTNDFTGSELRELVRVATVNRMKRIIQQVKNRDAITASTSAATIDKDDKDDKDNKDDKNNHSPITKSETLITSDLTLYNYPLTTDDFIYALQKTTKSENVARDYEIRSQVEDRKKGTDAIKEFAKSFI